MTGEHSTESYIEWVEHITANCVNLTAWEETFIESMLDKISRYGDGVRFSDNEKASIEKVYSERTP